MTRAKRAGRRKRAGRIDLRPTPAQVQARHSATGRGGKVNTGNGLTRRFAGGPAASREARRRAIAAEQVAQRRLKAWQLYVGGADPVTFNQVGHLLGVSGKTAWMDIMHVYRGLQGTEDLALLRARMQSRLDGIHRAHWAKRADKASADVLLRVLEREARLHGLDRPQRAEGYTVEQMVAAIRSFAAVFLEVVQDVELRRQFALGMRRRVGPARAGTVDVAPAAPKEAGHGERDGDSGAAAGA